MLYVQCVGARERTDTKEGVRGCKHTQSCIYCGSLSMFYNPKPQLHLIDLISHSVTEGVFGLFLSARGGYSQRNMEDQS